MPNQMTDSSLLDCGNGQESDNIIIGLFATGGTQPYFKVCNGPTCQSVELKSPYTYELGKWAHLAVTYSTFSNKICIYLNANVVPSQCNPLTSRLKSLMRNKCYIGKSNKASPNPVVGSFDEIKIYNIELNAAQLLKDMYTKTTNHGQYISRQSN